MFLVSTCYILYSLSNVCIMLFLILCDHVWTIHIFDFHNLIWSSECVVLFVEMLRRFSTLAQTYLRDRRHQRSQYMHRKKARYASSRKNRYFAHMDYVNRSQVDHYTMTDLQLFHELVSKNIYTWCEKTTVTMYHSLTQTKVTHLH